MIRYESMSYILLRPMGVLKSTGMVLQKSVALLKSVTSERKKGVCMIDGVLNIYSSCRRFLSYESYFPSRASTPASGGEEITKSQGGLKKIGQTGDRSQSNAVDELWTSAQFVNGGKSHFNARRRLSFSSFLSPPSPAPTPQKTTKSPYKSIKLSIHFPFKISSKKHAAGDR